MEQAWGGVCGGGSEGPPLGLRFPMSAREVYKQRDPRKGPPPAGTFWVSGIQSHTWVTHPTLRPPQSPGIPRRSPQPPATCTSIACVPHAVSVRAIPEIFTPHPQNPQPRTHISPLGSAPTRPQEARGWAIPLQGIEALSVSGGLLIMGD